MRKGLVLLVLLLLAAVPIFGQWHRSMRLSVTDSISYTSRTGGWGIGVSDEDVHITWYDKSFLSSTVRYGHFPIGCCLETPASGIAINSDYGCEPVLSASDTNAHIDWYVNSLYFREATGMAMSPIVEHGWPGTSNLCPAVADDASGNTHCVFNYYDDSRGLCLAYQYRAAGGNFSPPVEIIGPPPGYDGYLPYYPTICIGPDGNIHVAWIQSWKGILGYGTSPDGSNWTVSEILSTYVTYCDPNIAPSICSDKWGNIHVVYAGENDSIYRASKIGGMWNWPVNLSKTNMIGGGPSICADTLGTVWSAWHARYLSEEATAEIYGNDPYEALTSYDSYESRYPNITADPNGNIHIIWSDSRDGNFEIYYNWRLGPGQGHGRDLAVTCIFSPVGRIENQFIVSPRARIGNFGEAKDSCYANCKITGPGSSYSENSLMTKIIGSGQDSSIGFLAWTSSGNAGDVYEVKVTVYILPDSNIYDDNPANNVFIDSCIIRGVAVTATTILEPQEGDTLEHLKPAAYFRNTGTEPAANFYCHCDITSTGFQGGNYADSVLVAYNLAVGDSVFIEFDDYGCEENCSYVATFHATSATEDTIYSPHIQVHFYGPYVGVAEPAEVLRIELAGTNPFGTPPCISYSIGVPTEVCIRVYDVSGKLVKILHDGELSGKGTLHWNGRDQEGRMLAAGLYFVRILTPQFERTHKIVLMR